MPVGGIPRSEGVKPGKEGQVAREGPMVTGVWGPPLWLDRGAQSEYGWGMGAWSGVVGGVSLIGARVGCGCGRDVGMAWLWAWPGCGRGQGMWGGWGHGQPWACTELHSKAL